VPALGNEMMGLGRSRSAWKTATFSCFCGNMIPNTNVEKLRNWLTLIQEMSKEELKRYYKEQRRMVPDEESKGSSRFH